MNAINVECPRCGGGIPSTEKIGEYPGAMSRYDRNIEICSQCGHEEALAQFNASMTDDHTSTVVHPVFGEKLWVHIPKWL